MSELSHTRTFRALSLDFWFTSLLHNAAENDSWKAARSNVLARLLLPQDRESFESHEIDAAVSRVDAELSHPGHPAEVCVDPGIRVAAYAMALNATLTAPPEAAAQAFSDAGLRERPPRINPELNRLLGPLTKKGIPVIAVTNTSRRGSTWRDFFDSQSFGPFREIVTSCEVGSAKPDPEIFRDAARRLDIPLESILHVGDRWEDDVVGALAAGCGAALYRGLWNVYPKGMYPETDLRIAEGTDVLCIDHLEDLLDLDIWTAD